MRAPHDQLEVRSLAGEQLVDLDLERQRRRTRTRAGPVGRHPAQLGLRKREHFEREHFDGVWPNRPSRPFTRATSFPSPSNWRRQGLSIPEASKRSLRLLSLSGYGMSEDVTRSLEAGFMAHLVNPVSLPVLANAIRRACG